MIEQKDELTGTISKTFKASTVATLLSSASDGLRTVLFRQANGLTVPDKMNATIGDGPSSEYFKVSF